MVQLRSCYFCGTTEALSEYETLPSDLREHNASQRVVLCDRCHTKLTNVLTPIVERFEDADGPRDAPSPGGTAADEDADATSEPDQAVGPTDDESSQTDVTFTGVSTPDDADATTESPVTDPAPRNVPPADEPDEEGPSVAEAEPSPATATSTADAGGAGDRGDVDDASEDVDEDGAAGDRPADEPGGTDTDATGPRSESTDDAPDATDTESASTDDPPVRDDLDRVYHKLLRFLRNREFPIPRAEAEAVAQSAYDLTAPEAAEVIGRAVDRGVLEERDGELHRP
ncbi:hypothetical protein [Salinigranum marinum]|uniref:hypothetical protein n=1 Tax=Salinigranum marinum TaxID=1515595 RepID=UPI002989CF56|nr:hypothetical protein [Salinigranum marinum]